MSHRCPKRKSGGGRTRLWTTGAGGYEVCGERQQWSTASTHFSQRNVTVLTNACIVGYKRHTGKVAGWQSSLEDYERGARDELTCEVWSQHV